MKTVLRLLGVCLSVPLSTCLQPVSMSEWPLWNHPLLKYAVWVRHGAKYGSGAIIHSSPEKGTYVLTTAHVVQNEPGVLGPRVEVEVGIWSLSHRFPLDKDHEVYSAEVIASTGVEDRKPEDAYQELEDTLRKVTNVISGRDLAVLRIRTDRLFVAARLFRGTPEAIAGKGPCDCWRQSAAKSC